MPRSKPVHTGTLPSIEGGDSFEAAGPAFVGAMDLLSNQNWPPGEKCADVTVAPFRLPSGDIVWFVAVIADLPSRPRVHFRICEAITGSDTIGNRAIYEPHIFNGARLDDYGNVTLDNGLHLHKCEVVARPLGSKWTLEKHAVVAQLIIFLGATEQCVEQLEMRHETGWAARFLPLRVRDKKPEFSALNTDVWALRINYSAVRNLNLRGFKLEAFWQFHKQRTKQKKQQLSRQTIANILRHAGVRIPDPENISRKSLSP